MLAARIPSFLSKLPNIIHCSSSLLEDRINFGRTFEELRRRKVFRTAATYLAASFVLLQVADLTFEPLGISADAYRLLVILCAIGFPIAVIVSWFFDVRAERARDDTSAERTDPALRRWTSLAAVFFVVICAGAIGWFSAFRYSRADYGDSVVVAVLPFDVIGSGDIAYLRTGMVEMISRNVDGAANVRAVAPDMVIGAAKNQQPAAIARQFGARYLVSGNIVSAGGEVRITATIQDYSRPSSKPIIRQVTTSPQQLLDAVDHLSAQVLASTRSGEDAHLSESAALTTTSLPALRSYLEGEDFYRSAEYDSAALHFTNAVAVDSTFALAYYRLATAQLGKGHLALVREPLTRALQLSARLAERDQRLVRNFVDALDGRWREAEAGLRALHARYPEDAEVTFQLGALLSSADPQHGRSIEESKKLLEQVTSVDSKFLCPI